MKILTTLLLVPNILWAATQFLFVAAWVLAFPATTASWPWYVLLAPTLVAVGLGVGFVALVTVLQATLWKNEDTMHEGTRVLLVQLADGDGHHELRQTLPVDRKTMLN